MKFIARRQPFIVCHIERASNELEQVARDAIAVASGALRLSRRCDCHVFPRNWPRPYCTVRQRIRRLATVGRCFKPSPALQPPRRKSDIAISIRVCYNSDAVGNRDVPLPRAVASWTAGSRRSACAPNLLAKWDVGLISQKCDAANGVESLGQAEARGTGQVTREDQTLPADEQGAGMTLRFWGVRGSLPAPGPTTARYGGNTSCVELRCGPHLLILDAGTGLRELGAALTASGVAVDADILLSHTHLDHISGLPFFAAMYDPGRDCASGAVILLRRGHRPGVVA